MSEKDGGTIIAEVLQQHGIRFLFTLCGGHIAPILVGAKKLGIKVVDTRDEANAAFAADAVARLTGTVGVAVVTAGPGVTNAITAVKNAQMAQSPLLLLGGATATILEGRGSLQDIDQLSLLRPCTKWATSVRSLPALVPTIERALRIAQEGVPGPVFVEVPMDLQYPESLVREWYRKESGVDRMGGLKGKALDLYLRQHLYRQFHVRSPLSPSFALLRPDLWRVRLPLRDDPLDQATALLAAAERPVLVIGSQALSGYRDGAGLAAAVERLGIPTFLGGMARGLLGRHNALQLRHKRSVALKEADVVVVAGFPFDFRLGYGRSIGSDAKVIAANLDARELRKNRRPQLAVQQHPGHFLEALAAHGAGVSVSGWLDVLRAREQARDAEIAARGAAARGEGVDPVSLFSEIEERMGKDALIIVDGGDFAATGAYVLRPRGALRWLDPGVFGTLGVGGGFAVGAALVHPESEVWLIYGDGSSAYSLAELDTCVRHGLAPIAVVGTDGSWAQIAREQIEILGDDVSTVLRRLPYEKVAEGYGAVGLRLERREDIGATLAQAQEHARAGRPVLINVMLAASDFRKGSLSM